MGSGVSPSKITIRKLMLTCAFFDTQVPSDISSQEKQDGPEVPFVLLCHINLCVCLFTKLIDQSSLCKSNLFSFYAKN